MLERGASTHGVCDDSIDFFVLRVTTVQLLLILSQVAVNCVVAVSRI